MLRRYHIQHAPLQGLIRLAKWLGIDTFPDHEAYDRRRFILWELEDRGIVESEQRVMY